MSKISLFLVIFFFLKSSFIISMQLETEEKLEREKQEIEIKHVFYEKNIPIVLIDIICQYARKLTKIEQDKLNQKLIKAIEKNNLDKIKKLVSSGAQVNEEINIYGRPLAYCIRDGQWKVFELLLSLGADPNLKVGLGKNVFEIASEAVWSWAVDAENSVNIDSGRQKIVEILQEFHKEQEYKKSEKIIIENYFHC